MNRVWLNGALLDATAARIDPTDRGFTYGDGVFETLRAAAGSPCHAERHFARLRRGAQLLGIAVPFTDDILVEAMRLVLSASGLSEAALRLTLTSGPAARGLLSTGPQHPTLLIAAAELPKALPPARVIVAARTRRNEHSPLAAIKSLNYLDSILARREAAEAGADDALLLNTVGDLAEATTANIFLLVDGELATPRVQDGALPGIARALLLESAVFRERRVTARDLARAEAGCLVNSLGLRALSHIDRRRLVVNHQALESLRALSA